MCLAAGARDGWITSRLLLAALLVAAAAALVGCTSTAPAAAPAAPPAPTAAPTPVPTAAPAPPSGPYARIVTAAGRQLYVKLEVADTPQARATGLSNRPSLPGDAGMLFVFPADQQAAFWMKDTLIPLSIAFISSEGRIVEIQDMERLSEDLHRPALPYRYALEVNQGFFKKNEVSPGDRVEFHLRA